MSNITPTIDTQPNSAKASWLAITEADTGLPVNFSNWADRSVQVTGDFDASGAITMEGSNDAGTTYSTLNDFEGNALVITAAGIYQIAENPELIRPRATAGTSVSMNVYLLGVR